MLKNKIFSSVLHVLLFNSALLVMSAGSVMAMDQYPYFDPQKGYQIKMMGDLGLMVKTILFFRRCMMGRVLNHRKKEVT